ncbi:MAG: methyltransferase domain-containing protein [Gammaproteobacteria bacterium]|nr:methyltransferase domain-containing protein [Gammaproteobacteria bacterium]
MSLIHCPVCGHAAAQFDPVGVQRPRHNAKCPACGAYERHRLVWWYLCEQGLVADGMRVLDVAPMPAMARALQRGFDLQYVSIDSGPRPAGARMDLERLAFGQAVFDGIVCMHVLEHVDDDRKALRELARVLRPGAWAVLMVPINERMPHTDEDPSVTDPAERERRFGQSDHVRLYGADYLQRCSDAGFRMQVIDMHAQPDIVARFALLEGEKLFIGWRK